MMRGTFIMKKMLLLLITVLLVISPVSVAQTDDTGWVWLNPLPQGNTLRALWGTGPNNIYAVGDVGTILHYDGSSWQPLSNLPGNNFLLDIWGAGPNDIFAVGQNALWHYNGTSWQAMSPPSVLGSFLMQGVWGSASNNVYAVGVAPSGIGIVLHYNGIAWSMVNTPLVFDSLYAIWGSDPNHIFVVGEEGVVLYYNGRSWQEIDASTEAYFYDVWGSGPNDVYAVGYSYSDYKGVILHYDGSSWKQVFAIPGEKIYAIWGFSANDIYIVTDNRTVYRFDGHTWQRIGQPTDRTYYLYDLWGAGPDDMFVVGKRGVIAHYDGLQWSEQGQAAPLETFRDIWTDGTHAVAVGGLRAFVYDGRRWILYRLPPDIPGSHWLSSNLYGLWGTSWDNLYAVSEGLIWHFDGQTWTHAYVMVTSDDEEVVRFRAIWGSGPNDIYAVGYIEGLYPNNVHVIVHYDGSQWSTVYQASGKGELVDIWGSGPDDIFVAATDGGMLHYDGRSWSQMSTTYFDSVWGTGPNNVWATGETPAGLAAIFHHDGRQWRKVYEKDVALNRIWGLGPNNVFAMGATTDEPFGISAGLWRAVLLHYDGSRWSEMDAPFPEIKAMHGTDKVLLVVGRGGAFLGCGNTPPPLSSWATPTPTPSRRNVYLPFIKG